LTRALAEKPKIGKKTKIDAAVSKLEPFPTWNETSVELRQRNLRSWYTKYGVCRHRSDGLTQSASDRARKLDFLQFRKVVLSENSIR
jgi:hypothetical protein